MRVTIEHAVDILIVGIVVVFVSAVIGGGFWIYLLAVK